MAPVNGVLGIIPYETFPMIELGPLHLRTFGLMVAIGVLVGAFLAARYGEEHGVPRDTTYSLAMRMVIVGIIGARLTWVVSHTSQIDSPLDVIAVWQGGLQFSGGFLFAVAAGYPVYRTWNRVTRWHSLDGYAYGLTLGLGIGRIACTSVGEHFGRMSHFFLAVRYDGGSVRESTLGNVPLQRGMEFHNTAIYELIYLVLFFLFLTWLLYGRKQRPPVGTVLGLFCCFYGVARFASDSLRVNDDRFLHLTGAQYLCLALVPTGIWILRRVRRLLAEDLAAGQRSGLGAPPVTDPLEAPSPDPG
jgi:phosphatidylglycerol:prolipoprotein diacylglycerol transferase